MTQTQPEFSAPGSLRLPATARLTDALSGISIDATQIKAELVGWQQVLHSLQAKKVLFRAESSLQWALLDLACLDANILLVPVPAYLSERQWQHVLEQVAPDVIIVDLPLNLTTDVAKNDQIRWSLSYQHYQLYQCDIKATLSAPAGTQKITFTSGSTGQPKGVCLTAAAQWQVAQSLVSRINLSMPRHLCLLPLPTLLENIAGIYAPLLAGGEVVIASEAARGFQGSRLETPALLLALITKIQPDSLILVPELLQLLVHACLQGWSAPASLKFIAVGGAKVAVDLLKQAAGLGLPVYQGYGLSECCSVVALSEIDATQASQQQLTQVGRVLPHLTVKTVAGEIFVKTPFLGYLGDTSALGAVNWVATGDLGTISADGLLTIHGRKKNLLILSSGRNVNPEWVEAELTKTGLIQQALLTGDAKPYCVALLYCANAAVSERQLTEFVQRINQQLPDYARAERWIRLATPFSEAEGTLTANGRPKRDVITARYQREIDTLYPTQAELSRAASLTNTIVSVQIQEYPL